MLEGRLGRVCLVAAVAALATVGCKDSSSSGRDASAPAALADTAEGSPTAEAPRLVALAEIAEMEKDLLARVKANQERLCPRPVLRGDAKPGSAEAARIAVIEGAEDTKACLALLDTHADALDDALYLPDDPPKGWPERPLRDLKPLDAKAALSAQVTEVLAGCKSTLAKLRDTTQYEDGCSPYLPGRRGTPRLLSQMRLAKVADFVARQALAAGDHREAVETLLDVMRFDQDLARGGASLIHAMVGVASNHMVTLQLEQVLNSPGTIPVAVLDQIDRELSLILKTVPHPGGFLAADHEGTVLLMILPKLKPKGWTPPGGWGDDKPPGDEDQDPLGLGAQDFGPHPEDSNALAWLASNEAAARWPKLCPKESNHVECIQAIADAPTPKPLGEIEDMSALMAKLADGTSAEGVKAIRRKLLDILGAVASPAFSKYVRRHGGAVSVLASLRLHAAFRKLAQERGSCPQLADFDAEPLAAKRMNPADGQRLIVEPSGPGRYVFRPGSEELRVAGPREAVPIFAMCPPAPEPAAPAPE